VNLNALLAFPLAVALVAVALCIVLIVSAGVAIWSRNEQRRTSAQEIVRLIVRLFYLRNQ
jgi:hypothetical protein